MGSSEIVDSGRVNSGPVKSSFSQTCNLFSQYLKENNNFPDLSLGRRVLTPSSSPTMNLFPMAETPRANMQQPAAKQPMTIFYNGQVIVFNDLSPEKVEEIMKVAESGQKKPVVKIEECSKNVIVPNSDLPIARKASLARFLEKRKDRITARSPYQVQESPKQEDSKTWLGLGAQSHVQ
ncbi:ZIM-domain protein 4 [Artemisia annua]|uniref:Protein TIFY n=2 Tax=Artemisia annua TaxID=35608 RepID=A0A2U1KD99_ARTAN|nr:ZIM-domain protein 4 [Artemisia annua]